MAIDINNGLGRLSQESHKATEQTHSEGASRRNSGVAERDASARDSVKISEDANSLRAMQTRLERQESFDEARVSEIREAISQGKYPIDNQRLAEKFLQLENQL